MVPEGWTDATLGDLVRLQRGHDLPAHSRVEGDIEVIGGGGPNGYHNEAKAPAPGIVIGRSGSGIGNAWWSDKPFWPLNTGMYVTDFLGNDPRFCFLWLDWIDFTSHNTGGAQPSLNRNFIYPIPIPIPPLPEQQKIAEILSTWDRAIETSEALLATACSQKRALMQSLLTGKRRFPEFEGQDWSEVRFEEVFARVRRKNTVGNENTLTISGQDGLVLQQEYFNKRVAAADLSGYTLLVGGDFAYNKSYSTGYPMGAIKMLPDGQSGVVSSLYLCFALADPDQQCREFFRHFFEAGCFNHEIYKIAQEGARNHGLLNVSVHDFFRAKITIPERVEQERIADAINLAERVEARNRAVLEKLRTEKKALMQQLLTGKRRVAV